MNISNKFIIAEYIDKNKDSIIRKYNENMPILEIARLYGVEKSTICLRLVKWGIKIKKYKAERRRRNGRPVKQKKNFSPELQAKMKKNSEINDKRIRFYNTVDTGKDKFLVRSILEKSGVVANE